MARVSNYLLGILNFFTLLISIAIIAGVIWSAHNRSGDCNIKFGETSTIVVAGIDIEHNNCSTKCQRFLETPTIVFGVFLLLFSVAGFIGSCFRVTWLLFIYLLVMFLFILFLICFTIFVFVVTNPGAGKALSNRGYNEYRLGDYSNWLQKRIGSERNWRGIKSCLVDGGACYLMATDKHKPSSVSEFYARNLSPVQSGCCKPDDECNFEYVSPTVWNKPAKLNSTNPDCALWDNNNSTLCFNCSSCKAGFIDTLKHSWKWLSISNAMLLVFLIIVYSCGCCAFRNNRNHPRYKGYP